MIERYNLHLPDTAMDLEQKIKLFVTEALDEVEVYWKVLRLDIKGLWKSDRNVHARQYSGEFGSVDTFIE